MRKLIPTAALAWGLASWVPGIPLAGQTPTVQEQLDALREGQARLERELAELKLLLKERPQRVETAAAPAPPSVPTLSIFGEPFKGADGARVAILEYSDFDCTFCAKYVQEIYPKLQSDYVKTGKVRYYFRDWPSSEHPRALQKAALARCAGEQGQFWEAHDFLFAEQKGFDPNDLAPMIQKLGLDGPSFMACASSGRYAELLRRSGATAERMRLRGTPAFLVGRISEDGRLLEVEKIFFGAESFQAFKTLLDDLLAGASKAQRR